jgi:CRISPR/Cas system CMR-associated protein Cmr5 small subunit
MNNSRIEKMIPKAIKYIEDNYDSFKHEKKDGIDKVYSGYINSFGPTVLMSGLKQTLSFYKAKENNKKVCELFIHILKDADILDMSLDELIKDENSKDIMIKNKVLDAVVASKLAIGTFKLEE